MALISFWDNPIDVFKPSVYRFLQHGLDDHHEDLEPTVIPRKLRRMILSSPYNVLGRKHGKFGNVTVDKSKFQLSVDVHQYAPEELTVKVADNCVTIEGKHEEKSDDNNYSTQSFYKKFTLPKGHDLDRIQSKLTPDGMLTITAPKEAPSPGKDREIPITLVRENVSTTKCVENDEDKQKDNAEKDQ